MSRPFVSRPEEPVWFFCADCCDMYDGRDGHVCGRRLVQPFWSTERAFAAAISVGCAVWVVVVVGIWRAAT